MEKTCQTYSLEDLGSFVDKAVDASQADRIKAHIDTCAHCSHVVDNINQISRVFARKVSKEVRQIDTGTLENRVLSKVHGNQGRFYKKVFDYFSPKLYVKIAALVVIMVVGFTYFTGTPVTVASPSAIVKSVNGNMSSVMIFETQKTKHTIIWFSET